MNETLEQYFNKREATRLLVKNLRSNSEALIGDRTSEDEREDLLRVDLIMIRQAMQDCGVG